MRAALALLLCALAVPAYAQGRTPLPRPTGDLVKDINTAIKGQQAAKAGEVPSACDFNLFAALSADNVIAQIQQCVAKPGADIANAFLPDVTAALDSATAYGDQVGVSCLKPGLAIVVAGAGKPGTPAVPATATAPEVPGTPPVYPGPMVIFQKFREFELSGGPAACKSWVTSTVAGALAP